MQAQMNKWRVSLSSSNRYKLVDAATQIAMAVQECKGEILSNRRKGQTSRWMVVLMPDGTRVNLDAVVLRHGVVARQKMAGPKLQAK